MDRQVISNPAQDNNELRRVRFNKLAKLRAEGKDPFLLTTFNVTHHSEEVKQDFVRLAGTQNEDGTYLEQPSEVSLAGRIMFRRIMGRASFADIQDRDGQIQLYVSRDNLGDEAYNDFKHCDVGDIIGVQGIPFRTKTGEISIRVLALQLLSKSLEPLPEKFHGLQDTNIRYRQRYLDLIMNRKSVETFQKRSQIIYEIRRFLADRDFIEVETPILVSNAGGAAASPFETHYNALDEEMKLRISLELYLKRLIVGGLERVFEIGRAFRNEGIDTRHNPEFTLMELYQAYTDYNGILL